MSKCDLKIVLDRPDRVYQVGEMVTGHLDVVVNADCTCNGLKISRYWQTHGRGNRASGGQDEEILFTGQWRPGQTDRYPFEFEVPAGPLTYHGHYLNVDWYLHATADIPWAFDPKTTEEFIVEKGDADELGDHPLGDRLASHPMQAMASTMGLACGLAFGAFFLVPGCIFSVVMTILSISEGQPMMLIGAGMGLVFALVGIVLAFFALRNTIAQRKLGPVTVTLEPDRVNAGQESRLHVHFSPKSAADLNGLTATLRGKEVVVSGSGTNRSTHSHIFHNEQYTLLESERVAAGEDVDRDVLIEVPGDAPASFAAPDNRLVWEVEVHVDIKSWPDFKSSQGVIVLP